MNKKELSNIVSKVENKAKFFKKKSSLDTLSYSEDIIGREKQTEQLVEYLSGFKQGFVVPLVSIYGRSGSGKSTIARFVCENLDGVASCFVNLRQAKTVFGCVNMILGTLGQPNLKSYHGLNMAKEKIKGGITERLAKEGKSFLVLILDEFDVLFFDRRSSPSDFIYRLLLVEEELKSKGIMMCVVCISNNVVSN